MPARILIGTASWVDKPLIDSGTFYPPHAKTPEARLRYYATRFPMVEADTSYYAIPSSSTVRGWIDRTPEGFTFDVKAYSLFTEHPAPLVRMPREVREVLPPSLAAKQSIYRRDAPKETVDLCWIHFLDALIPLADAGKLGMVVFQFPKWVMPSNHTYEYFWEIRERLGNLRAAFEFRNAKWLDGGQRETTFGLLQDMGVTYICVDEPQGFPSSVPPIATATSDRAFVRFHGRNTEMWEARTKTASERFDYYYRPDELDEWVPKIKQLALEVPEVHLVMNTNNYDQGPANADLLGERLAAAGVL